jgi:4'-phosphopantetheinyl transferase
MLKNGQAMVWRAPLDSLRLDSFPAASQAEQARAAGLRSSIEARRYLAAHRALRAVLSGATNQPLDFAIAEKGKPYLPAAPEVKFSLAHSSELALIAVALDVEVGVDVERIRPVPEWEAIARRFFPPSEAAALAATPPAGRERDFFRRWTRIEAMLKAQGVGLYGAGAEMEGQWTVEEIAVAPGEPPPTRPDARPEYAAAVAAARAGMRIVVEDL